MREATLIASLSPEEWTSVFGQRRGEVPSVLESEITKYASDVMTEVLALLHTSRFLTDG